MKKVSVLTLLLLAGCVSTSNNAGMGVFYSEVIDGVSATSLGGSKTGRACSKSILNLVAVGDSSIKKAAKNGGITKINSVDVEKNSFFVYGEACTVVRGE